MAICPTCGRSEPGKVRSPDHMRRYFAVMNVIYACWPEKHEQQFESMDAMRVWLQMRAGHYETTRIDLGDADPDMAVVMAQASMKAAGTHARARVVGTELVIFKPLSIAFSKLSQHEFSKISSEVEALILAETGIEITDKVLDGEVHVPHPQETDPADDSESSDP